MNGKQVLDMMKKNGWKLDRVESSHHIMKKEGCAQISVPVHGTKDLKPGLLHKILKAAGLK